MDWMSRIEAMRYFGLEDEAELEDVALEFDMDVDLDDDDRIIRIGTIKDELQEVLFKLHDRKVGHRPDDPAHGFDFSEVLIRQAAEREDRRKKNKGRMKRRVERRSRGWRGQSNIRGSLEMVRRERMAERIKKAGGEYEEVDEL